MYKCSEMWSDMKFCPGHPGTTSRTKTGNDNFHHFVFDHLHLPSVGGLNFDFLPQAVKFTHCLATTMKEATNFLFSS